MDEKQWERVQVVFHAAVDLSHDDQQSFLRAQCGDDVELLSQVQALLKQDKRGSSLLDRNIAHVAHEVLGDQKSSVPDRIGPYLIKGILGEGGMGVVYLAERADLHSQVALKVLRDAPLSPARRVRFAQEQRTLAQLNHPSIARLYNADVLADGTPFFVMEYVDGVPLTQYCTVHRSSLEERLRLFRAVCEAVQFAHGHAVIHRDLKPSNILVKADGTVRLLDFGISKQLESVDLSADQSLTLVRLMTPAYAAPEQIRGTRIGAHTDVYSLGVILYELLTGRVPFDLSNCTPLEAELMITEHEPVRPSTLARKTHQPPGGEQLSHPKEAASWADLDILCLTAMHKAPERRYRSVEALIRDIDHYAKAEPLEARPDNFRYRAGKFLRRNGRVVWTSAAVLVLMLTMGVIFTFRLAKARNVAMAEAARTQRIQAFMLKLFEGGDKEVGPAMSLRVTDLLDRGVQEAQALAHEPEAQAELYQTLGSLYQKSGQLDRAESLLNASLQQRRALFGTEHAQVAESLVALGLLKIDQAKLEEAERLIRDGLEMSRRGNSPENHPAVARAVSALGQVLEERGSYDEAIRVLDEAVRLRSKDGAESADLAASLYELANAHFYAGHYPESETLNQRALGIYTAVHGDRHPLVADVLVNLGAIQFELGRYKEAEQYYRKALDITENWFGKEHYRTAADLTMLGRALVRQERYEEAVGLLNRALQVREKVYGPSHPSVASTVNELATVEMKRRNLDRAETGFRRMAAIYRSVYGDHHYLVAVALSNLASVEVEREEYARAEKIYRDVVERFTQALSADHLNTGIAEIKLGRTLVRQGRYAEAESVILTGYNILNKQTNPAVSYLQAARKDLVVVYDATNRPERAGKFRDELASLETSNASSRVK